VLVHEHAQSTKGLHRVSLDDQAALITWTAGHIIMIGPRETNVDTAILLPLSS
jgi:hypothetical protein